MNDLHTTVTTLHEDGVHVELTGDMLTSWFRDLPADRQAALFWAETNRDFEVPSLSLRGQLALSLAVESIKAGFDDVMRRPLHAGGLVSATADMPEIGARASTDARDLLGSGERAAEMTALADRFSRCAAACTFPNCVCDEDTRCTAVKCASDDVIRANSFAHTQAPERFTGRLAEVGQ